MHRVKAFEPLLGLVIKITISVGLYNIISYSIARDTFNDTSRYRNSISFTGLFCLKDQQKPIVESHKTQEKKGSVILKYIHDMANEYARLIPGGKYLVDAVFKDIEVVYETHAEEVGEILFEAYFDMIKLGESESKMQAAMQGLIILKNVSNKIWVVAGISFNQVLDEHPLIRKVVGESLEELQKLAYSHGPAGAKKLKETQDEIKKLLDQGSIPDRTRMIKQKITNALEDIKNMK